MLKPAVLLCFVLGHHRSRRRARYRPDGELRSVCTRCGTGMIRQFRGWSVADGAPPLA